MKFRVEFSNGGWALYQLTDSKTTGQWARMIESMSPADRCRVNTLMGAASADEIEQRCQRLSQLAHLLRAHNSQVWLPPEPLAAGNIIQYLGRMHQHFPEMYNHSEFAGLRPQLDEYNDTIHWLETAIRSPWGCDIKLDFKSKLALEPIAEQDLGLFTTGWPRGAITLHYAQTGRHAAEMYWNRDTTTPRDQWQAQTLHSASCYLRFRSRQQISSKAWSRYWQSRGGQDYWGMAADDPQLRLGYLVLGQLLDSRNLDPGSDITSWNIDYE